MQVAINTRLYGSARAYAEKQGLNLTKVIEDFLVGFISKNQAPAQDVPDVVLSLLGAGEPVNEDDLNGRDAYYKYLEEKYK